MSLPSRLCHYKHLNIRPVPIDRFCGSEQWVCREPYRRVQRVHEERKRRRPLFATSKNVQTVRLYCVLMQSEVRALFLK
jgi:hypothetical protein